MLKRIHFLLAWFVYKRGALDKSPSFSCISIVLIALTVIELLTGRVSAIDIQAQPAPTMVRVEPKNTEEPAIGYNEFDKHYIDMKWDVEFPPDAYNRFLNFYMQEIPKPYRPQKPRALKERDVPGSYDSFRLKELSSGTIYYVDMTAYHTKVIDNSTYSSPESVSSNKVKVLTNINISAFSVGTNKIKIEWDDVWNSGGRIDYKLYVSENSSFTNAPPIYIGQSQIGKDRPVTVNEATGKLEYLHTVRDSGRVYYIRIEPDVAESELKRNQFSNTVIVSSFIMVRTSKISSSESGIIWKLEWSPVVTGLSDSSIKIVYQIYRGFIGSNDLPQYMAAVDDTSFFITLPPGDVQNYFIIRAIVTKDGEDLYKNIRIESDQIIVGEQEVSSRPATPELVEKFERVLGDQIISYKDELKPTSATILWRAPAKDDGKIDTNVMYDIWLLSDPNILDNPPESYKIGSDIKMNSQNNVMNGNNLIGYKFVLSQLTPNSTYYFKIIAKKQFVEYVDDVLQPVVITSDPAVKVIITPVDGPIDQPLLPGRPPLKIKKSLDGKELISENSVTIQLKNLWYEKYDFENNIWKYIRSEKLNSNDTPPFNPYDTVVDDVYYRKVLYDEGVTIDVSCIKYEEGMSYEDLKKITANKVMNFPVAPNDMSEDPKLNPDNKRHNVDITLNGLEANTVYVIWARAVRNSVGMVSQPSDPIIITTDPYMTVPVEKPVVPTFNYSMTGDTFVGLGWEYKGGYNYYLKYATEDDITKGAGEKTITSKELQQSLYYKIEGLTPDTLYYFWVQAESVGSNGESVKSEWSDSYPIRTLQYEKPQTPIGFGIKNNIDAITKNSITFEWIKEENVTYILEIGKDLGFVDGVEYSAGGASEFKVEGLSSNHRYFARLYAFDTKKGLRSIPTSSITVKTQSSSDDYDSDADLDSEISGEFVEKDKSLINGVWNVKITGINAQRFSQSVIRDNKADYKIDLTQPPEDTTKVSLLISDIVFKTLTSIGENLFIKTNEWSLWLRPGLLTSGTSNPLIGKNTGVDYQIYIQWGDSIKTMPKNLEAKTDNVKIDIKGLVNGEKLPVNTMLKPLGFVVTYSSESFYTKDSTYGFIYQNTNNWVKLHTSAYYNKDTGLGKLTFDTFNTGDFAVAATKTDYYDDIYYHKHESSINNVADLYEFKSAQGRLFRPDLNATYGDTVKFMLDVLKFDYGADFMEKAAKGGIIPYGEVLKGDRNCTVGDALNMLLKVIEIKSKSLITGTKDEFIRKNGFVLVKDNGALYGSNDIVKRAEVVVLIEKALAYLGELE